MPLNAHNEESKLDYAYRRLSRSIRSILDELRDVAVSHVKFALFLELIDFHLNIDAIPPGLEIEIKPLGFCCDKNPQIWSEWKEKLKKCSKSLMGILRYHYLNELSRFSAMKSSLRKKAINSTMLEKMCSCKTATGFVDNWIEKSAHGSIDELSSIFYTGNPFADK